MIIHALVKTRGICIRILSTLGFLVFRCSLFKGQAYLYLNVKCCASGLVKLPFMFAFISKEHARINFEQNTPSNLQFSKTNFYLK